MPKMNTNDDMHYEHEHRQPLVEVPPMVGPERPPVRNDDNACPCASCPCPCAKSSGGGGGGDGGGGVGACYSGVISAEPGQEEPVHRASSEAGDSVNDGDEGTEDHLIEVGDFGYISLSLIHRSLAKHARCTCHGILPSMHLLFSLDTQQYLTSQTDPEDYPFSTYNSPIMSGMTSPGPSDSMMVENGSAEQSMASSGFFGLRSRGSSIFEYMHGGFEHNAVMEAFPTLYAPLQLTADVHYPMELSYSSISERDYSTPADDFSEYDMW